MKSSPFIFVLLIIWITSSCQDNSKAVEAIIQAIKKDLSSNNPDYALGSIDKLLQISPDNPDAYNLQGVAYLQLKKHKEAIQSFNQAIKLDDSRYKYFYNRGNVFFEEKKFEDALSDFQKAIEKNPPQNPQTADLYSNRATTLALLNRREEALQDFDKAIELNPADPTIFYRRGKTYLFLKNFKLAEADLQKVTELSPKNADAYYFLASAQIGKNGNAQPETCQLLQKAMELGHTESEKMWVEVCQNPQEIIY